MTSPAQVSGFLNVDKPSGLTSHDVVYRVRRHTGVRRVGHAGTLDPFATGVLVLCLGQGTRLAQFLTRGEKVYRAVVELGRTTDTYDRTGQVVEERDASGVDREQVERALNRFRGRVQQVPPAYSAVKQGGVPLYRLARGGQKVAPPSREVEITEVKLVSWEWPRLTLELTCSAGTYVRSLAHDLGQLLGCGAHLAELTRLRSGRFCLDDAVSLDAFLAAGEGEWLRWLHPLEVAVEHLPRIWVDEANWQRLAQGQAIGLQHVEGELGRGRLAQATMPGKGLVALVRLDQEGTRWLPDKVLVRP